MTYTIVVAVALAAAVTLLVALLAYPHFPRRVRARPDTPAETIADAMRRLELDAQRAGRIMAGEMLLAFEQLGLKVRTAAADIRSRNDRRRS
jgi:hypothetical protein